MRSSLFLARALLCALVPASAWCDTIIMEAMKDNTLIESEEGLELSNAKGWACHTGRTNLPEYDRRRAMMAFDLAGNIPAGSTITSVTLRVHVSNTRVGTQLVQLRRLLASWGEGTSDAGETGGSGVLATPGDATWRYRFWPTALWTTPGGDFSPTATSQVNMGGVAFYVFPSTAQFVTDAQLFLDQPDQNFGWLVLGNEAVTRSSKRLETRESENESGAFRSRLIVNFTPPAFPLGDMNCDGMVSVSDIGAFVLALTDPAGYATQFPSCDINLGDLNDDGIVSVSDIGPFVLLLTGA